MNRSKLGFNNLLILFLIIYPLFSTVSIRGIAAPIVAGFKTNNLILIIPIIIILKFFLIKKRKYNLKLFCYILAILTYLLINSLISYNGQTIYSILFIILPMLVSVEVNDDDGKKFDSFVKILILISIFYSLFVIVEFYFYNTIAPFLNLQTTADYVTRHSTMLGSSITTSYFLLMNIPVGFIGQRYLPKKWKRVSIFSIILCTLAIVLAQSRICFATLGVYVILYFLFFGKNIKIRYKLLVVLSIVGFLFWILNNESLSRLYTDYSENLSFQTRNELINVGLSEFANNPIFGSGISKYYKRLWYGGSSLTFIGEKISLIDSHNLYVYILVEQGIIGFVLYFGYLLYLIKKYITLLPRYIKYNVYILLIGQFLVFFGGSQLMNEINYSIIFWAYLLIFCSKGLYTKSLEKVDN